ncbi:MAG: 3-phosphoshikimate 1-carboxyvinyltransferase [Candidatus Omnitrophica bacterium]|nr:3-phosphoshikimate 1-carboxyvinyltransferase [Candidatus Omnitrophota bacterium]
MKPLLVKPAFQLRGRISLAGDKSIAHRSIILSCISKGKTIIDNFPDNKDCFNTLNAFKKLGIKILCKKFQERIIVYGRGLYGLKKPKGEIFVGDSGTTLRIILGVLAGQGFKVKLTTGGSLAKRPMLRVTEPLRKMGAFIEARGKIKEGRQEEYPPIVIKGGDLKPITYKMPLASAQVKSAILLAGLYAKGKTCVIESIKTRDHTERMLKLFKAKIISKKNSIIIEGRKELVSPGRITIPGDISSAGFFIVAGTVVPGSEILIENVNLNPLRIGIIKVLKRMGANIRVLRSRVNRIFNYEPVGDILVKSRKLKATRVKKEEIPTLIDELPVLMVAASLAEGKTVFEGVNELRVKETDRIRSMVENLKKMGAIIKVRKTKESEDIIIEGIKQLTGARVKSFGDHRTAMSMVIAGLVAQKNTLIDDISCINKSFPNFLEILTPLIIR